MRSRSTVITLLAGMLMFASGGLDGMASAHHRSTQSFPRKYDQWLNQDVVYIISKEERAEFLQLRLEDERNEFLEQFWRRRNPVTESVENLFEDEHYRRIAYANAHFGTKTKLGWQKDRGQVYIVYGNPDSIEPHPHGPPQNLPDTGFGDWYPDESWKYKYLEGVGPEITLDFVDFAGANDFLLAADAEERARLFKTRVPGSEVQGTDLPPIETLYKAPQVKFRELSEILTAHIVRDQVAFDRAVSFEPVTDCTVLTSITVTVPVPPLSGASADPSSSQFEALIRVQDAKGWVVGVAEEKFPDLKAGAAEGLHAWFAKTFPLFAGSYRVQIALKKVATNEFGTQTLRVEVPRLRLNPH